MRHKLTYVSILLSVLYFSFCACSQDSTRKPVPHTQHHQFQLGTERIVVKETRFNATIPVQLVHLHGNETTAGEVAQLLSAEQGIDFLQILNEGKRLIDFGADNTFYRFDPNRMFSAEGIQASLQLYSRSDQKALREIESFGESVLHLLDRQKTIVAVHNNTDNHFSLADYIQNKTGLVHQNPSLDPDDFFITTDSTLFQQLKTKDYNVVLEYSHQLKDDGSLSIYCSRNKIRYVNVEAEHGHKREQEEMLRTLIEFLR